MLGRNPRDNALIELVNLLSSKGPENLERQDIQDIEQRFRIDLSGRHKAYAVYVYRQILERYIGEEGASREDRKTLERIGAVLGLSREDIAELTHDSVQSVFQDAVRRALRDGKLTHREQRVLERLRNDLELGCEEAERIVRSGAQRVLGGLVRRALSDERLSDEEERGLHRAARGLQAERLLEESEDEEYRWSRRLWRIENRKVPEELPRSKVAVTLDRGERCYFRSPATWYVPRDPRHAGAVAELAEKASRSAEQIQVRREAMGCRSPSSVWKKAGQGALYVTSRRLVFSDDAVARRFDLRRLQNIMPYSNGVMIVEEQRESRFGYHFFEFDEAPDLFLRICTRAVSDLV